MPSLRIRYIAAAALIVVAVAAAVLYVIHARAVHADPPEPLRRLIIDPHPGLAPTVAFSDPAGGRDTVASFRGHYVLLNLWATWCAPCVRELPELARLKSALPTLMIVAVNEGRENASQSTAFLKEHGAGALTVYVDSDAAFIQALGIQGLPYSLIVDPQGRTIARALGPCRWSAPEAVDYLRALTARPAASS